MIKSTIIFTLLRYFPSNFIINKIFKYEDVTVQTSIKLKMFQAATFHNFCSSLLCLRFILQIMS
jgi:hypothetical protein